MSEKGPVCQDPLMEFGNHMKMLSIQLQLFNFNKQDLSLKRNDVSLRIYTMNIYSLVSKRSRVGVRDPGRYPEFLCGCKRPGEVSQIFFWV